MKKKIFAFFSVALTLAWLFRYYTLNGGMSVHGQYPEKIVGMHETIEFGDSKSYNVIEQPGYSVSLESARIIDTSDYLEEIGKTPEDFDYLSEKYLELTLKVSNEGDYTEGIEFYALPVIGEDWYTFYDNQLTACINPFFEGNYEAANRCAVKKDSSAIVKIAYNLYYNTFPDERWNKLDDEKMWMSATIKPVNQMIKIEF